jgi:hypothetical protein
MTAPIIVGLMFIATFFDSTIQRKIGIVPNNSTTKEM